MSIHAAVSSMCTTSGPSEFLAERCAYRYMADVLPEVIEENSMPRI